ncbi:MAG: class I SAM-dependent methyltransferase, partial [Chloroflexi bacterium]|nr:class I SAM-dependent methyltransferase [Chloroflexota bacterium]
MTSLDYSKLYDESYFRTGCGSPYERTPAWLNLFAGMADRIVRSIGPVSVLDAGCAMGFLVEALRDRGVEAYGVDISQYAIDRVREDIRPYCWVGSITDPLPQRYDLVVCIEVLEHLPTGDCERAVESLCRAGNDILISASPDDFREATHFNVQPPEYWASRFAELGFLHDVEFDTSFITAWAMRFRKRAEPLHRVIAPY